MLNSHKKFWLKNQKIDSMLIKADLRLDELEIQKSNINNTYNGSYLKLQSE